MIVLNKKMPKSCWECFTKLHIEDCPCNDTKVQDYKESRHPDCPIVAEIPDKHGRLIDASELAYESITDYTLESHLVVSLEDIKNAPTILKASKA